MPLFLLEGTANTDQTSIFSSLTSIFTFLVGLMGDFIDTITGTPLLFVPVIVILAGSAILFAVGLIHRLGIGNGGRRRRARR